MQNKEDSSAAPHGSQSPDYRGPHMENWYKISTHRKVVNSLVERVIACSRAPELLEIYGTEITPNGPTTRVELLDMARVDERGKLKPKAWLRQIFVHEVWVKKGDWFAYKMIPTLAITMVHNEKTEMWERIEI